MLWKLLIVLGLLPCAAYWLARYFFYLKPTRDVGRQDCRISVEDYAAKFSYTGKIPRGLRGRRDAAAIAQVALLAAYEELRTSHEKPVAMRQRADTYALIAAPFSLMILFFALFVGKQFLISLAVVAVLNAIAAAMKFTSRSVATHAVDRAIVQLKKARIPRQADESAVEMCLRALTWR